MNRQKFRGRSRRIALETQLQIYKEKKSELLDKNNTLKSASQSIYEDLSLLPQLKGMTRKAIHLTIVKNIFEIFGENIATSQVSTKSTTHTNSDDNLDDSCTGIESDRLNLTEEIQQSFRILSQYY